MKKYSIYLLYLIPISLIALYQSYQKYNPLTKNSVTGETVIYQMKITHLVELQQAHLSRDLESISNKIQWIDFLDKYLQKSKKYNSSKYVGYAMAAHSQIASRVIEGLEVQLKYAELLEYAHQFETALEILNRASTNPIYRDEANLRMLNIHGLRGEMGEAEKSCNKLHSSNLWKVSALCDLWIMGMKDKNSHSLEKIINLEKSFKNDIELSQWMYQLIIDLMLKNKNLLGAEAYLSKLKALDISDNAALIQMVDFAILTKNPLYATRLLKEYDSESQLMIRSIIVNKLLTGKDNDNQKAEEAIEVFKNIQEKSQYRLISMWEYFIHADKDLSLAYANLNLDAYKTENDYLLQNYLRQH